MKNKELRAAEGREIPKSETGKRASQARRLSVKRIAARCGVCSEGWRCGACRAGCCGAAGWCAGVASKALPLVAAKRGGGCDAVVAVVWRPGCHWRRVLHWGPFDCRCSWGLGAVEIQSCPGCLGLSRLFGSKALPLVAAKPGGGCGAEVRWCRGGATQTRRQGERETRRPGG